MLLRFSFPYHYTSTIHSQSPQSTIHSSDRVLALDSIENFFILSIPISYLHFAEFIFIQQQIFVWTPKKPGAYLFNHFTLYTIPFHSVSFRFVSIECSTIPAYTHAFAAFIIITFSCIDSACIKQNRKKEEENKKSCVSEKELIHLSMSVWGVCFFCVSEVHHMCDEFYFHFFMHRDSIRLSRSVGLVWRLQWQLMPEISLMCLRSARGRTNATHQKKKNKTPPKSTV